MCKHIYEHEGTYQKNIILYIKIGIMEEMRGGRRAINFIFVHKRKEKKKERKD